MHNLHDIAKCYRTGLQERHQLSGASTYNFHNSLFWSSFESGLMWHSTVALRCPRRMACIDFPNLTRSFVRTVGEFGALATWFEHADVGQGPTMRWLRLSVLERGSNPCSYPGLVTRLLQASSSLVIFTGGVTVVSTWGFYAVFSEVMYTEILAQNRKYGNE